MTRDEIVGKSRAEGGMFIVIPSVVALDEALPLSAQMLYGIITWKCSVRAYTWATNRALGEALGVSAKRVSVLLSLLEERGHIETEIEYKEGTKEILRRYIYPIMKSAKGAFAHGPPPENEDTLPPGTGIPLPENEEVKCNNKYNNKINTPYSPPAGDKPACRHDGQHKRFIPPDVEQVRSYCRERNNGIDPETFVDYYASKGWMVGRSPMKDWRAAIRTWEQRRRAQRKEENDEDDCFQ